MANGADLTDLRAQIPEHEALFFLWNQGLLAERLGHPEDVEHYRFQYIEVNGAQGTPRDIDGTVRPIYEEASGWFPDGFVGRPYQDLVQEVRDAVPTEAPPDSSYVFGPHAGRPWTDGTGRRVSSAVLTSFRPGCGWAEVAFLQLGWPLVFDHRDTSVRQYVRDPQGELPRHWGVQDRYEANVQLPADARHTGYSTDGIQLWLDPSTSERHVYLVFADGVELWPRADPIVACG